jgi:hypothetical protein
MTENFANKLSNTLIDERNVVASENGALGFRTSGKALLDLNFSVASMRSMEEKEICQMFMKAFEEDKTLALKWLFFARDVRGGLGERRLFRVVLRYMTMYLTNEIEHLFKHIAEFGRWDDLVELSDISGLAISMIQVQLTKDLSNLAKNEPVSLLAKWLPSINTSSKESVKRAKKIAKGIGLSEKDYRKNLSKLRKHLDVVEVKMSGRQWKDINYPAIPSKANLLYSQAFLKHDKERRSQFLTALQMGESKINAGVLFPHDIVHQYRNKHYDVTLEEMWRALPSVVDGDNCTIVVADGSGSMETPIGKKNGVMALEVANALAIYYAERLTGAFQNKYITFSRNPELVDLNNCTTLAEKLRTANLYYEAANTNIQAVFELILKTAVNNKMSQEDLPKNILIISDMEFDIATNDQTINRRLFQFFQQRYKDYGFIIPRLVFWNVNSRTGMIPLQKNGLGIVLVSGFSIHIAKMVMSGILDPYQCLVETLMAPRYECITAR